VVLPASGWEIMANVFLWEISASYIMKSATKIADNMWFWTIGNDRINKEGY
jgi:hypothetical protein